MIPPADQDDGAASTIKSTINRFLQLEPGPGGRDGSTGLRAARPAPAAGSETAAVSAGGRSGL